jgi:hypothetical protein
VTHKRGRAAAAQADLRAAAATERRLDRQLTAPAERGEPAVN